MQQRHTSQQRHSFQRPQRPIRHHTCLATLLLALGVLLVGVPSEAARFDCPAADATCLIAAINQANANGQENAIVLAAGSYTLTAVDNDTDGANGLPSVTGRLTIRGAGAESTVIQRDVTAPRFRVLHVGPSGVLTLRGVTLTRGEVGNNGSMGAGLLSAGAVTITDSVISENGGVTGLGTFGGGVAATGTVVITRSTISRNAARAGGGGVFIGEGGTLTVASSVISGNYSGLGGGVRFASSGALSITDTRVLDNTANLSGGAGGLLIGAAFGPARGNTTTITRSTIAGNLGVEGGGIGYHAPEGRLTIDHSAIVGNQAIFRVGGVVFTSGTVTITESTVANNTTGLAGPGGVLGVSPGTGTVTNSTIVGNAAVQGSSSTAAGVAGPLRLQNSIVAGNTGKDASGGIHSSDCGESIVSLGNNLFGDPAGCGTLLVSDRTGDAGLGTLIDPGRPGIAHVPLLPGSQAIDAGDTAVCGATDQQGLARPIDGDGDGVRACDIGAVEFYPVLNDLVELQSLRSRYNPPSAREQSNPLTAGGTFEITAVFANVGAQDICHVAFQVTALRGEAGGTPTVVTQRGALIGGEGIIVPATLADAKRDLRAGHQEKYRFIIGLSHEEPITFLVNVVGEAAAGCRRQQ